MFKSRPTTYITYRKRQRSLPLKAIVLATPLVLIFLEVLARLLVGITGKTTELAAYEGEPAIVNVYRLKFLDQNQKPYDGLSDRGQLSAQRSLAVGYRLVGNQQSSFWQINEQGFRDDNPVPLAKPKDEIRIFLLGGSTAFGQWNPSNKATLASKLEARLNERIAQQRRSPEKYRPAILPFYKPDRIKALALPPQMRDGQYRVINAAVPGYASGNQLAQLALQILPYSPDAIVVLDGYTDLLLPSDRIATDIPHMEKFLSNAPGHLWIFLTQQLRYAIAEMYLVRATQYWILRPQPSASRLSLMALDETKPLDRYLAAEPAELERRVARYREMKKQMVRLTTGAKIRLIVALQPEITGLSSSKRSSREQEILNQLGPIYQQRVQMGYDQLQRASQELQKAYPKNLRMLSFYQLDREVNEEVFYDAIHLTEQGNALLVDTFYRELSNSPQLQVIPPKMPK
ncbi:MAG TPA: GDSL family lipase [Cyanobacteria bacterium UBA8803]|nr:GDSL family lipase [Cyanobacteria bacterium UBA9273]HBL61504.1 GDSL family lipase [Cyanobacteria bacterium UBA8803]